MSKIPVEQPKSNKFLKNSIILLLISVLFHFIYLGSIFDIYFKSPVTEGVPLRFGVGSNLEHGNKGGLVGEALAKRVVLIVGDGLRADKLFQTYDSPPFPITEALPFPIPSSPHSVVTSKLYSNERTTPAPYLRNLIQSGEAEWGVSHTSVPTESRPGHVALIAGMLEDVSAVTRGWSTNPVPFDSCFNQSTHTFSFGSNDILPMFSEGASDPNRVDTFSYGYEYEDFTKDAVELDLFVLKKLKELLSNSTSKPELDSLLRADGTIFFLHLLGCDTTGHSYRPDGPEYHRNIRVVDYVVEETVKLLNEFYNDDGATSFIFTADHGMSALGNHGDGIPENTRTPLVAWGAGIGGEKNVVSEVVKDVDTESDEYYQGWELNGIRRDVKQVDIADLMSILGGLNIPANSAGRVPLDYLNASPSFKARAALANANQILAEFAVKSDFKEAHAVSFRPFLPFVDSEIEGTKSIATHRAAINEAITSERFVEAQEMSKELVRLGLDGLRYFQTYDWLILRTIVTLGYLGFMAYSTNFILQTHVYSSFRPTQVSSTSSSLVVPAIGLAVFATLATRFILEKSPISYFLYAIFPCYFWSSILRNPWAFKLLLSDAGDLPFIRTYFNSLLVIGILQLMVIGYSNRIVFTAILLGIGLVWPILGMSSEFRSNNVNLLLGWTSSCIVLAVFPALPVEKGENLLVILAGAIAFLVLGLTALNTINRTGLNVKSSTLARTTLLVKIELFLIASIMVITWTSARSLQEKKGLPFINQVLGWILLVTATSIPIIHGRPRGQPSSERLLVLLLGFAPAFIILSLSYEALFFAAFCTTLYIWLLVETELFNSQNPKEDLKITNRISSEHIRIALFFLVFFHAAFFGVGNIASISSFYLEPVYRLMPIFAPFPMAILLLFKLLIPFVALSAISSILIHRLLLPPYSLFIIASTLSDFLTISFFFLVKDEGSWLEIGSTISNFAICSLLCIFNSVLFLGGEACLAYTV